MGCLILGELIDAFVGIIMIRGFFSRKLPLMHRSPFSLLIGSLFIADSLLQLILSRPIGFLEFMGVLIFLALWEKFISENTGTRFNYLTLIPLILTVLAVLVGKNIKFFHFGTLLVLSTVALRTGQKGEVIGWYYRDVFFISSLLGFLGALSFLLNFPAESNFFYFGGLLLYMLAIGELIQSSQ